jgi:hypothetical protein
MEQLCGQSFYAAMRTVYRCEGESDLLSSIFLYFLFPTYCNSIDKLGSSFQVAQQSPPRAPLPRFPPRAAPPSKCQLAPPWISSLPTWQPAHVPTHGRKPLTSHSRAHRLLLSWNERPMGAKDNSWHRVKLPRSHLGKAPWTTL